MAAKKTKTIRQKLLAQVHIAKKELGLDDDLYREMLYASFRVKSAKYLNDIQLAHFIDILKKCGWKRQGKEHYPEGFGKDKYENLGNRKGFATPAQLRLIEALWDRVSFAEDKETALRRFLENRFRISHIRFLTAEKASRVIDALKDMYVRKCFETACRKLGFEKEEINKLHKIFWKKIPGEKHSLKDKVLLAADMQEGRILAAETARYLIEIFYELIKSELKGRKNE